MADSKYISKVRIGNEDFAFRDKEALAAAKAAQTAANNISVPVDGVTGDITFKDANGKMYKLALDGKKVKLVAVTYNAPTISISGFKWNGAATTSYSVDAPNTSSVTGTVAGTITVSNGQKPTCGTTGVTISGSGTTYTIGGSVAIANNGSTSFQFTTKGATVNPSTGTYDSASTTSITISRTATVAAAWTFNATALQPESNKTGGFKFTMGSTAVTPTTVTINNNTTVTLKPASAGYIYIFTNAAKSFVMSTDKATVDSAKLGGGVVDLSDVQTYSIGKTYKVYRSLNSFAANTNVYVKAIV